LIQMTARPEHDALHILQSAHLRRTAPRIAVLDILLTAGVPLSCDQIAERIGPDSPNRVTVYRTIETLVAAGVVHQAYLQDRTWMYELGHHCSKHQCHPHFTCIRCGNTSCLPGVEVPMPAEMVQGYAISHQRVQWEGLCPGCGGRDQHDPSILHKGK
jgi:Fur family transcriptional regulator, ferric uptake regulator